jgi:hypothetical protein
LRRGFGGFYTHISWLFSEVQMLFAESAIVAAIVPSAANLGRPKYPLANFYSGDQSPVTVRRVQWMFFSSMVIGTKEEPNIVGGCHLDRKIDALIRHTGLRIEAIDASAAICTARLCGLLGLRL